MLRVEWNALRSRLARRLAMSFVLCAAVPFVVAAGIAQYEIYELRERQSADRLHAHASSYGMALIGRLVSADGVLRTLTSPAIQSDEAALAHAATLEEFRSLRQVAASAAPPRLPAGMQTLPWPSFEQQHALTYDRTILLWDRDRGSRVRVFLVRKARRPDTWLYAELQDTQVWGIRDERPVGLETIVTSGQGELMHAPGSLPASLVESIARAAGRAHGDGRTATLFHAEETADAWSASRWQVFLKGAFAAPSWEVTAVSPRAPLATEVGGLGLLFPGFLGMTLLAVLWLSIWKIRRYLEPLEKLIAGTRRVAHGQFDTVDVRSDDEFGELARSFNQMTRNLEEQFTALETMSEVDRMLLRSPGLEQVLDALLPRMASVLGSPALSVLLFDGDGAGYARAYDFVGEAGGPLPVRRIAVSPARIDALFQGGATRAVLAGERSRELELIAPRDPVISAAIALWPFRSGREVAGLLCIALAADRPLDDAREHRAREFADRLAVVLANVEHEKALYRQAHYDPVTRLPNRTLFGIRLENELAGATGGEGGALLYIDLDDFKEVNDTAGHVSGDELLKVIGQRVLGCVKESDTVARLGGDEFAVVLRNLPGPLQAREAADRILASIAEPIQISGRDHYVSASIGVTLFPEDGRSVIELLKNSDIAMYRAKETGRGLAVFFEPVMNERMLARAALEADLRRAFRESQFELHYQPILDSRGGTICGAEALLRWPSAPAGFASPATFIPVAEESGLIVDIGAWAIETACRQLTEWRRRGRGIDHVSVNVSPRQLREASFPDRVREILEQHRLPPYALQLEITESVLADVDLAAAALARLAELRVRIALDDFGTGYSSLSYLRRYPIDVVKIDRSFIQDVAENEAARTLVETIIAMSHTLRKTVVAEGVETIEQLHFLYDHGCDAVQGYLLYRPMKPEQFEALGDPPVIAVAVGSGSVPFPSSAA